MRKLIDTLYFACLTEDVYNEENQKVIKNCIKEIIKKNLSKDNVCDLIDELYETSVKELKGEINEWWKD